MKKALLIVTALALVLGASTLAAANTYWQGKYSSGDQGIWKGTLYDDPTGPAAPHFEGKWASMDVAKQGKMYATLKYDGIGKYKIVKGVLFDEKGNVVGYWDGYFDLTVKPGVAGGSWAWIDGPVNGMWKGQMVLSLDE